MIFFKPGKVRFVVVSSMYLVTGVVGLFDCDIRNSFLLLNLYFWVYLFLHIWLYNHRYTYYTLK